MNRTLSCTVGEHFLIKAWWWLKQNGQQVDSISGIARLAVQTVAGQLEGMPPQDVIDQFRQTFEGVGRTTRTAGVNSQHLRAGVLSATGSYDVTPREKPYWEIAGCPTRETFEMWTKYLVQNGLNKDDCSYLNYVKQQSQKGADDMLERYKAQHGVTPPAIPEFMKNAPIEQLDDVPAGCDASLPIAVNDTPEELNERVRERQQREQLERDEMQRATAELAKQLSEGGEENGSNI